MDDAADEPIPLPIEDSLDLHTIRPDETREVVAAYVEEAARLGYREVRVIHGRGTGTQRALVRQALRSLPVVVELRDAPPERGGWGATIVTLSGSRPCSC